MKLQSRNIDGLLCCTNLLDLCFSMQLSSSLQSDFDIGDLYVNTDPYKHPALRNKSVEDMLLKSSKSEEVLLKGVICFAAPTIRWGW